MDCVCQSGWTGNGISVLSWRSKSDPFKSLTFALDVGEARGEMGDLGLRE